MYLCVRDIDFVSVSTIFLLDFENVPKMWSIFISILYRHIWKLSLFHHMNMIVFAMQYIR
jgi:hypothetical protein